MDPVAVILNPAAKGEKAIRMAQAIRDLSPAVSLRVSEAPGAAETMAAEAVAEGFATVVAAGGDGTVNAVVNGLGETGVRLGILPIGTMNVYAAELGLPTGDLRKAWEVIRQGTPREVDLPMANGRYFVQLAGVGLDAQIVQETDWEFRKAFGPLSYLVAAAQIAARKPPLLQVAHDGGQASGCFVLVGNGRFYGGPFELFPGASCDDGLLDLLVFRNIGHLDIIRFLQGILFGTHTEFPDVEHLRTTAARVESTENVPVETDGEVVGVTPVDFRLAARRLHVLV